MRTKFLKSATWILGLLLMMSMVQSCKSSAPRGTLNVYSIGYKALDTEFQQVSDIPENAEIVVKYEIKLNKGFYSKVFPTINVWIQNRTDGIMIIDKTKSFYNDVSGVSHVMSKPVGYDKTVNSSETTSLYDKSNSSLQSSSLQYEGSSLLSISPYGSALLSTDINPSLKLEFDDMTIDDIVLSITSPDEFAQKIAKEGYYYDIENSPLKFGFLITYMFEDKLHEQHNIKTNFFLSSDVRIPVNSKEESSNSINDAIRTLLKNKPDAFNKGCWWFGVNSNIGNETEATHTCSFYDYN